MYTIRGAGIQDIPVIKELFRETVLSVNIRDYSPVQVQYWAERGENNEIWKERIGKEYFILALSGQQITGFAALKDNGYLDLLYIHKEYQHKGIASLLLSTIEEYALQNNLTEITSDVSITARPFFESKSYIVLMQQTVDIGIEMINFKMRKLL